MKFVKKISKSFFSLSILLGLIFLIKTYLQGQDKEMMEDVLENESVIRLAEIPIPQQVRKPKTTVDDLKKIEGIGPKIASTLQKAGIQTFADLAGTSIERLDKILRDAEVISGRGKTWPEQARLANEGKWDALKELQSQLKGGLRP